MRLFLFVSSRGGFWYGDCTDTDIVIGDEITTNSNTQNLGGLGSSYYNYNANRMLRQDNYHDNSISAAFESPQVSTNSRKKFDPTADDDFVNSTASHQKISPFLSSSDVNTSGAIIKEKSRVASTAASSIHTVSTRTPSALAYHEDNDDAAAAHQFGSHNNQIVDMMYTVLLVTVSHHA